MEEYVDFMKEYIEEEERNLLSVKTGKYMDWLLRFVSEHGSFCEEDWLQDESISPIDYENIKKLQYLYIVIEKYCQKEMLPIEVEEQYAYSKVILWRGKAFQTGIEYKQSVTCFVNLSKNKKDAIKYTDIISGKHQPGYIERLNTFEQFSDLAKKLKELGVPCSTMQYVVRSQYR